jgi:Ca2+-dependent lipid-binding protein
LININNIDNLSKNPNGSDYVNPSVTLKCGNLIDSTTIKKKTFDPVFEEVFFFEVTFFI